MNLAPVVSYDSAAHLRYANGLRGVLQTLGVMRSMVNDAKVDPLIRQRATDIVFVTPSKDAWAEAEALFEFVRDRIRYTRDVHGVETLSTPQKKLEAGLGDCDDQSTLLAALLESVGYPTRFVVAGYSGPTPEHVYLQVLLGDPDSGDGVWVDCDPTESGPLGWAPPDPAVWYAEQV